MNARKQAIKPRTNIWKWVALAFMAIFIVIIILGIFRSHRFRPDFTQATDEQVAIARNSAMTDLQNRGVQVEGLTIKPSSKIRQVKTGSGTSDIMEIAAYNQSVRHLYIIDVQSGEILMYSMTEFHDGLDHSKDDERRMGQPGGPLGLGGQIPFS